MTSQRALRTLGAGLASLAWIALALRLYLTVAMVRGDGGTLLGALAAYLAYFTILSNLLTAAILTAWGVRPDGGGWLRRPGVRAAAVVYMAVVGAVYALLLRRLWDPTGLALFCDVVMHDIMPVLYALYWLLAAPRGRLAWRQPLWWLLYPGGYFGYSLARGLISGSYPYPFIDVTALGYGGVLVNAALLLGVFWVLGLAVVGLDKALARRA
jgi:hypothetical protein